MQNKGSEPVQLTQPVSTLPQKSLSTNKSDLIVLASSRLLKGCDQQKIKGLESNVSMMNADFALLKKAKDEAKLKLEHKFVEVQKQLDTTKIYVETESKKTNETFAAFQSKFAADLDRLMRGSSEIQDQLAVNLEKKFIEVGTKCQQIEKIISKEKEERTSYVSNALAPLIDRIDNLEKALELERDIRKQKEKEMNKKFTDQNSKVLERFDTEKLQTMAQIKELNTSFKTDIKKQENLSEDLVMKVRAELRQMGSNIEREMDTRFEQQDKIVDNLTHMVKTFQATLKVISEDL